MDGDTFLNIATKLVWDYYKEKYENDDSFSFDNFNTFIVWACKTLQNNKAIIATNVDNCLFEATNNGDAKEVYIDVYDKLDNILVRL